MDKPLRESLAQSVCNKLEEAILNSTWKHTLPSIRSLCAEMMVSKQTMMNALQLLEKSGYVKPTSRGKPREISVDHSLTKPSQHTTPVIGLISYSVYEELTDVDQEVIKKLNKLIDSKGLTFKLIVFKDLIVNAGAKNIKSVVRQNPADIYVVLGASPASSRVLRTLNKPIVYLGGDFVKGCSPRIGFSFTEICNCAIDYLVTLGHSKITVMLPENFNRKNRTVSQAESYIEKLFTSKQIPFSTYNCPRWGKTTSDYYEALEQLFAVTPPTAILLGDSAQMPRLASFLMSRGLRYPDDISIIILDKSSSIDEYRPKLSYIEKPVSALVKITFKEINKLLTQPRSISDETSHAKTKLIIQDSVRAI